MFIRNESVEPKIRSVSSSVKRSVDVHCLQKEPVPTNNVCITDTDVSVVHLRTNVPLYDTAAAKFKWKSKIISNDVCLFFRLKYLMLYFLSIVMCNTVTICLVLAN